MANSFAAFVDTILYIVMLLASEQADSIPVFTSNAGMLLFMVAFSALFVADRCMGEAFGNGAIARYL